MKNENPSDHGKDRQQTIEVVERNWRAEVETAQVYRDLAERERDEKRKGILLRMAEAEERHEAEFHDQADRALAGEQDVQEFLRKSALEEKAHARVLSTMAPQPGPRTVLDTILKRERWHGRGGSWVADAIYGVND